MSEKNEQQPLQHYSRPQMSRRQDPNLRGRHADSKRHNRGGKKHTSLWVSLIIIAILIISIGPLIRSQVNKTDRQDLASPKVVKKSSSTKAKKKSTSKSTSKAKSSASSNKTKTQAKTSSSQQTTTNSAAGSTNSQSATSGSSSQNTQTNTTSQSSKGTPSTYVVKSGDTLSSIASQYGLSVDQLTQLNNLTNTGSIQTGQTLKLK
ncbi:MAG: LysM peptidoglycan-binding domain-containing protein [Lactobacillus sp.]|jgi:LysM repeat protein|nr:LysM peptidoglycan-binding domain-containing protein [Lactobacillus sp.]MCH3906412.1 LysM peptidoglycan-binding domain-containing protein [Lactobacillus sp.]MCH3990013.1 LysM peptidoglycan-binding domain-containing protein [Lactobacillus sp.]MCH4069273.1 LysM peptidoglycan-binding domain-containing protein [Lactobacillus sp.]MCI1303575.1 LysM peptidoglycan-binding domain-containing protein [Lactobacillus sp.]